MKTLFKIGSLVMVVGLLSLGACRKDSDDNDSDTMSAQDNAQAELFSNDANEVADQAAAGKVALRGAASEDLLGSCAVVTHDSSNATRVITIDFGTTGCPSRGKLRRGKIIITYTGRYFEAGSMKTVSFDNYYVNAHKVEGTRIVKNEGLNTAGNPWWSVNVNMKVSKPDGRSHTWTSSRVREMIAGAGTTDLLDDVYSVTGSASGSNSNGKEYSANVTSALIKAVNCDYISKGTVEINISNKPARTLDFGNGTCDDQATVAIRGKVYTITLK